MPSLTCVSVLRFFLKVHYFNVNCRRHEYSYFSSVPKSVLVKLTAFTYAVEPIHYTVHEFLQRQLSS